MLINSGGYTIDITLNEIIDNHGNLRKLSSPSGRSCSMNINKDLITLVEEILGEEKLNVQKDNKLEIWKIQLKAKKGMMTLILKNLKQI